MDFGQNNARMMKYGFVGIVTALFLSSCTTMSKDECLHADWQAIGYEDGAEGKPVSAVSSRRSACAKKAGVTVDMTQYRAGREEGLLQYCTPTRGYELGSAGRSYNGACTGVNENNFRAAYEEGHHLHGLKNAVTELDADIRQAQYDLSEINHRIAEVETKLIGPAEPGVNRADLLSELKDLLEEKNDLENTLYELDRDHDYADQELQNYRDLMVLRNSDGPPQAPGPRTEY